MSYSEDDLLPISALQHLLFCPRQCALIHVDKIWIETRFTAEGRVLHERVHTPAAHRRGTVRAEFSVPLRSLRLGVTGVADVVEFHAPPSASRGSPEVRETAYPVEYKRGKPKSDASDLVQLCAQAMCLEEMLGAPVPEGAFFYKQEQRRVPTRFDDDLRRETEEAARRLHAIVAAGAVPAPEFGKKCGACSLRDACLPEACSGARSVSRYMASVREDEP